MVRYRSTGQVDGRDSQVMLLSGRPGAPRSWSSPGWTRSVRSASAALTRDGVGVFTWQAFARARTARSRLATWARGRRAPSVVAVGGRTTLTTGVRTGSGLDASVSPGGHGLIASVRHRRGADVSTVSAMTFRVEPTGSLVEQVETTWEQPVNTTVTTIASDNAASLTLGRLLGAYYPSPQTRYAVSVRLG